MRQGSEAWSATSGCMSLLRFHIYAWCCVNLHRHHSLSLFRLSPLAFFVSTFTTRFCLCLSLSLQNVLRLFILGETSCLWSIRPVLIRSRQSLQVFWCRLSRWRIIFSERELHGSLHICVQIRRYAYPSLAVWPNPLTSSRLPDR